MKDINKFTLDAVLTKPYMSREDFYTVLPVGRKKSDKLFRDLWNELKSKRKDPVQIKTAGDPDKILQEKISGRKRNMKRKRMVSDGMKFLIMHVLVFGMFIYVLFNGYPEGKELAMITAVVLLMTGALVL